MNVLQRRANLLNENTTCIGEQDAARRAIEQADTEARLELSDYVAECGRRHTEIECRGAKRTPASNSDDRVEMVQPWPIHCPGFRNATSIFILIVETSVHSYKCPLLDDRGENDHNSNDGVALVHALAPDAVVNDEGRSYAGREAIGAWWREAKAKYQHVIEPLDMREVDDVIEVRVRVTGQFQGSPAALTFAFRFDGDQITGLEIGA